MQKALKRIVGIIKPVEQLLDEEGILFVRAEKFERGNKRIAVRLTTECFKSLFDESEISIIPYLEDAFYSYCKLFAYVENTEYFCIEKSSK